MFTESEKKILELFEECPFKPYFIKYIEYKRSKGYKFGWSILYMLKRINNIMAELGGNVITKDMIDFVLMRKMDEDGRVLTKLVASLRQFTLFMSLYEPATFVVPLRYWAQKNEKMRKFVFTEEELDSITKAIDNYCHSNPYMPDYDIPPHPFIIRILIGTGMRIGEILSLRRGDIDLSNNLIAVLDGKCGVARIVPISCSLAEALGCYIHNTRGESRDILFCSQRTGREFSHSGVQHFIHKVLDDCGIAERGGDKPSIHSFRHTFCTHAIEKMLASGMDFYTALPILGAYVGHTNINDLEKYVHINGMAMQEFNSRQASLESLIPEVEDEDL